MHDEIAEAGGPREPLGQFPRDDLGVREASERVGVGGRAAQSQPHARRHRQVDHHLNGLPQVQDDRVRSGGLRQELRGVTRQVACHPVEMAPDCG